MSQSCTLREPAIDGIAASATINRNLTKAVTSVDIWRGTGSRSANPAGFSLPPAEPDRYGHGLIVATVRVRPEAYILKWRFPDRELDAHGWFEAR